MTQIGNYFFPFAQQSSFPKSKLRDIKLIKSIYVRHHDQSCSIEFMLPIKQSLLLISTDCWFEKLPSVTFYCFDLKVVSWS